MLAALGGPGERSILSQKRGTGGEGEGEGEGEAENSAERDGETSRERNEIIRKGEEKKREMDETPDNRISDAMNKEGKEEGKDVDVIENKEEEEGDENAKEEDEEKHASSREDSEEAKTEGGNVTLDKKGKNFCPEYIDITDTGLQALTCQSKWTSLDYTTVE